MFISRPTRQLHSLSRSLQVTKQYAQIVNPARRHVNTTTNHTPEPPWETRFLLKHKSLARLAQGTDIPLPSLAISFAMLHELTALVPLLILFFVFQAVGAGGMIVDWAGGVSEDTERDSSLDWRRKIGSWLEEGERRVEKVGRRYGLLGYEKGSKAPEGGDLVEQQKMGLVAAGSITNAVAAYLVTKALLPARIGLSLWATPAFARRAVEPVRKLVMRRKAAKSPSVK